VVGQVETDSNVANQQFASGQYQAALTSWLQELATRPPDARLVAAIGRANSKLGQFDAAAANFRQAAEIDPHICLLYTSPSPRDLSTSRMPSSA